MNRIFIALCLSFACARPISPAPDPGAALAPVATPNSQPKKSQPMKTSAPVLVGDTFVDPYTGKHLSSIGEKLNYEFARPTDVQDQYQLGPLTVDATTQSIVKTEAQQFTIEKDERIIRLGADGAKLWEHKPGMRVGSLRAPDLLFDGERAYVAVSNGVIALSFTDGEPLWKTTGPQDHLALFGDLVVAVDCTSASVLKSRWMFAYHASTGKEAFRVELPVDEEPETPIVVGDSLLVRGRKYSILLDSKGKELFRRSDRIAQMRASLNKWIAITDKTIAMLQADGKELWSLKGFRETFVHEPRLLVLEGGDLLVYNFGAISDSGVELVRLSTAGKELWRANVLGAMVSHSEYYHSAYVVVRGDELIVVSQGSYAKFIEVLSAQTGASLRRFPTL